MVGRWRGTLNGASVAGDRMRIAFFTPLSPLRTAVADHSEGLLPHLATLADVDLFIDEGYTPASTRIKKDFNVYTSRAFDARSGDYDVALYAMGQNADIHGYIYDVLQRVPGVIILHDTTLHRMLINLTSRRGRIDVYLDAMQQAYGKTDIRIAQQVLSGYGEHYVQRYPLIEPVVNPSLGVIVHNDFARRQVLRVCPQARVFTINQHFFVPAGSDDGPSLPDLRARWGLRDRFVLGTCGIFVSHKRIDICLRAFRRLRQRYPDAVYLFVGGYPKDFDLPGLIERLGLAGDVRITGWLGPAEFTQHMRLLDVAIHLRYPHIGGTPYTPIRLMGLGVPTILSDIEPLAELPEGACVKIPVDPYEEDTLLRILTALRAGDELQAELGRNGQRWISGRHDPVSIASRYVSVLRQVVEGLGV